ncbi:Putative zn(2)-C6 fungal-type DNA-binding domain-containing protein [Septoria linicola]|uniref:Zn(2)-C6 fungal-type DNA-binding domain-containing protein n=1 Tax=Septoria linicola TaxID=215465 RepID=A0A9Q9AU96_9PEZI|nr:Putative zn(2)-C6 fungal-type DNA-binding domain-containing protein [Septoria linicola]
MSTAAYSPTESQGDDGLSPQPLQRRATIGDPVYDNQAISRQRRKTAVVACERCRRRKIRCDGNQPCATCARFGVRCAKPEERRERSGSNAEHTALADRVRMLEARLAAVTYGEQAERLTPARPGPPSLHLDTSFNADLPRAMSFPGRLNDMSLGDDFLSPNVPTIQITGPHGSNPSSPLAMSPSPSLFSGTSRASSPDPFSAVSAFDFAGSLGTPATAHGHMRTPPLNQWAVVYSQSLQTPVSPGGHHVSRRSSVSSFGGLGESFCPGPGQDGDWSMHDPFAGPDMSEDFGHLGQMMPDLTPSKSAAEVLAEQVFSNRYLPVERSAFRVCLEAIYSLPSHSVDAPPDVQSLLSSYTPYSLRVARCLVFLVLSIGLRMNASSGGNSTGMDNCYSLAMQQMSQSNFWTENGAKEIAALLAAFAEVSRS